MTHNDSDFSPPPLPFPPLLRPHGTTLSPSRPRQPESTGVADALKLSLQTVLSSGGSGVDDATIKDLKRRQLIELTCVLRCR